MKTLISIMLLFGSFVSYSQTSFSDTLYNAMPGYYYESLELNSDLTFFFKNGSCTGKDKGKGLYSINNDTLILRFINEDTINYSRYFVNDCQCKDSNKLKVKIIVIDNNLNKKILFGSDLVMTNSKESFNFTSSGKNENYLISIPNKEYYHFQIFPDFGHLKFYKDFDFNLFVDTCKEVIVYLDWIKNSDIKNGTIMKYIINNKKLDEVSFKLTNKKGTLILSSIENEKSFK